MALDFAGLAAAKELHAIVPNFSFARSDMMDAPRFSITARLIADLLQTAGAKHFMTMMLHAPQVHGFYGIPADPLTAWHVFQRCLEDKDLSQAIVVSPDVGHARSAGRFVQGLGLPVAAGNRERLSDIEVRNTGLVGRQEKCFRRALIYDDEIVTGSSIVEIGELLVDSGIDEIYAVFTHGVFVRNALQRLGAVLEIVEIVTSDTVHIPIEGRPDKLVVLSVVPIFCEAIRRNYHRLSIEGMFPYGDD